MDLPMSWLKEYVDVTAPTSQYIEDITIAGQKVESVTEMAKDITGVITGKVLEIEKHPDADKLVVTKIDVGNGEPLQIVTGAPNLKVGDIVPVAMIGATVYHGASLEKIKKGKLRGIASAGMLCSIEELGFTRNDYPEAPEYGIYVFQEEVPLGKDVTELLQMKDDVVEFEITNNRPDCYSIMGLARESAAAYRLPLKYPKIEVKELGEGNTQDMIDVEIQNPELCPRYIARVVKNVKVEPSPLWLRHRLTAAGIRPINNIVDITNYVMQEYAQPMHAYDLDTIAGHKIVVKRAENGEKFQTLDGQERELNSSILMICDGEKSVGLAGIMGGLNSEIRDTTTEVMFEAAKFARDNIRRSSRALGQGSDASQRYSKGVDEYTTEMAMKRVLNLVEEL